MPPAGPARRGPGAAADHPLGSVSPRTLTAGIPTTNRISHSGGSEDKARSPVMCAELLEPVAQKSKPGQSREKWLGHISNSCERQCMQVRDLRKKSMHPVSPHVRFQPPSHGCHFVPC